MVKSPKKLALIGLDAPISKTLFRLAKEGKLPNFAKLIEEGVFAENCLVPFPTITPPNWTTIVTGAWPGTHGITCFNVHLSGDPLDEIHQGFDTGDCRAEYIWNAAEAVGKKSIIMNYPSSWPPTIKDGIQIAGAGLSINEWRSGGGFGHNCTIANDQLFSIEEYPLANQVELEEASGWQNISIGDKALETPIELVYRDSEIKVEDEKRWYLLVQVADGKYDRVTLAKTKDGKDVICSLKVGEWSDHIYEDFKTEKGVKKVAFRVKLIELSPEADKLRLYFTPLCQLDGWSYPEEVAAKIESKEGLPIPELPMTQFHLEWIDLTTFVEVIEFQNKWYADAATYLMKNYDWDLFFMHAHCPDWSYHAFIDELDPTTCKDKSRLDEYLAAEARFYESLDKMLGQMLEVLGEDTLIIIPSDHGAIPTKHIFNSGKILREAGLTVYRENPETGEEEIDWSRTKAVCQRSVYIYINLKGRDPDGIVEPGEGYERLRTEIIKLLYDYTDPETGEKPISLALRKEDARMIGLYSDRVGDIIYSITSNYGGSTGGCHGMQLPTAEYGVGSLRGLLIMKGPNIKKGCILKRNIRLTDIVPTVCYMMDIPIPKDAEGAIIYQAMEDPNFKLKEYETLKKNYERLKNAYEKGIALTHSYNK